MLRMLENRLLGRTFRPNRTMKTFKNEKLHKLHSSSSVISVIKSRRMRWTGHVPCSNEIIYTDVLSDSEEIIWKT